ncbi:MAG TPA: hypothetical protein VMN39_01795, partial [Longimicrobiaceae bacterium]|nr:hypothetical protein [Longimicrobiaceae bacterium]
MSRGGGRVRGRAGCRRVVAALLTLGINASAQGQDASEPGPFYVARDSVRVVYWGEQRRSAERTLAAALAPLPLPGIRGTATLPRGTVYLAPNPETFDSLTSGRTPEWAAGVAIPAARVIVLPAYRRRGPLGDPVVTLRHELAHLALNAYLDAPIPRWFDEGYATWVSGGWDAQSGWMIRLALLRGIAQPLDSLTLSWPRRESSARIAYLLSASAVRHLATSRGDPAFEAFLATWRAEGTIDSAIRTVYQMTLSQFEREWRAMVRRRYGWLLALSQITVFWIGLAVLVLVLGTLRRKRNRERLEELRREEYMLPAS